MRDSSEPQSTLHPLARWRESVGKTQADVARELGVDRSRICVIEAGGGCSLRLALKIEVLTQGTVRPHDLAPLPGGEEAA